MIVKSGEDTVLIHLHRELIAALATLDEHGRHAVSAHLVAAIELLEDDLQLADADRVRPEYRTAAAVLAQNIRDGFGNRAEAVIRSQLAGSSGSVMLAWESVLDHLK